MSLVTEFGRYDRAAVVARAKEIYRLDRGTWGEALTDACREAAIELRVFYGHPLSPVRANRSEAA